MSVAFRLIHRNALNTRRSALLAPPSAGVRPVVSIRRNICIAASQALAFPQQSSGAVTSINGSFSSQPQAHEAESVQRHVLSVAEEISRSILIYTPTLATESDLKALLDRAGLQGAQTFRGLNIETAEPSTQCTIKIREKENIDDAIAALSRLTLLGRPLRPKKVTEPIHDLNSLSLGWLPSPTNKLSLRLIRPPITSVTPLKPLLNNQWIIVKHLELLNPGLLSKIGSHAKTDARVDLARNFFKEFHRYDVMGMMPMFKHANQGWSCRILFGNPADAQKAAQHWRRKHEPKSQGTANIFRGGSQYHGRLFRYSKLLPEDMPQEEKVRLVETQYQLIRWAESGRSVAEQERKRDYPTPESAIGLVEDGVTST